MLIQGGTTSSGRRRTFGVAGSYCSSCITSFWNTTLPGVMAMLTPSSNALVSVMEIRSWTFPCSMSCSRLASPRTRFWPPVAIVSRNTSGFVSAKFDGASASMYWRVKASIFRRAAGSSPSTLAIVSLSQREVMR